MAKRKFKVEFDLGLDKIVKDLGKMATDIAKSTRKVSEEGSKAFGVMARESAKSFGSIGQNASKTFSSFAKDSSKTTASVIGDFSKMSTGISTDFSKSIGRMSGDMVKLQGNLGKSMSMLRSGFGGGGSSGGGIGGFLGKGILFGVGMGLVDGAVSLMKKPGEMMSQALADSMDLTAVNRKFDIVFGGLKGKANSFAKNLSDEMNGSMSATKAMMSRFQDTLVPMGFSRMQSFGMTKKMASRANDLAASEGISKDDAAIRIQSAMVGNHEAVRIFGVALTEASIKQELFNMKVKGGYTAATEQEKAMARLNIILNGTRDAQGAAARASGDLRGQLDGFNAVFTEVSARMGQILAPSVGAIVGYFKEIGVEINKSIGPSAQWGETLGQATRAVLGTLGFIKTTIGDIAKGFASFTETMSVGILNSTNDWNTFSDSMGKVFDKAVVMIAPFMLQVQDGVQQGFAGVAGALMGVFGAAETTIKGVIDTVLESIQGVIESLENAINLTQVLNPMTAAKRIDRAAAHSRNDYQMNRDADVAKFKKEYLEQNPGGSNLKATIYAKKKEEEQHRQKAIAIDTEHGVDVYGNPLKNSEASRGVEEARKKLKGGDQSTGQWLAEANKRMIAGFQTGTDAYKSANPLGASIEAANAAKTASGGFTPGKESDENKEARKASRLAEIQKVYDEVNAAKADRKNSVAVRQLSSINPQIREAAEQRLGVDKLARMQKNFDKDFGVAGNDKRNSNADMFKSFGQGIGAMIGGGLKDTGRFAASFVKDADSGPDDDMTFKEKKKRSKLGPRNAQYLAAQAEKERIAAENAAKDPYQKYLEDKNKKGVDYSSSEDLGKKMQAAFDGADGKEQLEATKAIKVATEQATKKLTTLATDVGKTVANYLGWGS